MPLVNAPLLLSGHFGDLVLAIGHTTHYELCVFQTNGSHEMKCADPDTWSQQSSPIPPSGAYLFRAGCSETSLSPNYGWGLAQFRLGVGAGAGSGTGTVQQNGFIPDYPRSTYGQVLDLAWKLRACNGARCSEWAAQTGLVWVPPPRSRGDTLESSPVKLNFKWYEVVNQLGRFGDVDPRLCISRPGVRCQGEGMRNGGSPGIDPQKIPWVLNVDESNVIDNAGVTLSASTHTGFNSYWFLGQTIHWTPGVCWEPPDQTRDDGTMVSMEDVCVYQQNYLERDMPSASD